MQSKYFKNLVKLSLLCALSSMMASCTSGSTLRTARTLDKGHVELSTGVSVTEYGDSSLVAIGAYGITDTVEIEARVEQYHIPVIPNVSATPRVQLLKSEQFGIDMLAAMEIGYGGHGFQWGPSLMVGRRWCFFEPYASYRFRHFCSMPREPVGIKQYGITFTDGNKYHYLKVGSRFYLPQYRDYRRPSKWFVGIEAGPTFVGSATIFEYAANIGTEF